MTKDARSSHAEAGSFPEALATEEGEEDGGEEGEERERGEGRGRQRAEASDREDGIITIIITARCVLFLALLSDARAITSVVVVLDILVVSEESCIVTGSVVFGKRGGKYNFKKGPRHKFDSEKVEEKTRGSFAGERKFLTMLPSPTSCFLSSRATAIPSKLPEGHCRRRNGRVQGLKRRSIPSSVVAVAAAGGGGGDNKSSKDVSGFFLMDCADLHLAA